jgi:hypothetical protein
MVLLLLIQMSVSLQLLTAKEYLVAGWRDLCDLVVMQPKLEIIT